MQPVTIGSRRFGVRFYRRERPRQITAMRMISSIFYPDCGDVRVLAKQMLGVRSGLIGYLPEERGLYRKIARRNGLPSDTFCSYSQTFFARCTSACTAWAPSVRPG
jgi:hypothetical protein